MDSGALLFIALRDFSFRRTDVGSVNLDVGNVGDLKRNPKLNPFWKRSLTSFLHLIWR